MWVEATAFMGVLREGMHRAGQAGFGLVSLNHLRGLGAQGLSLVAWCLALG